MRRLCVFSKLSDTQSLNSLAASGAVSESAQPQQLDQLTVEAYERRIQRLENEKTELARKLLEATNVIQARFDGATPTATPDSTSTLAGTMESEYVAQLKDEIQILKKRLADTENLINTPRNKDVAAEEWEKKYKELHAKHRQFMAERTQIQQVRLREELLGRRVLREQ